MRSPVTIQYVSRAAWGSNSETENFIRNRLSADPDEKETIHAHHTARIDTLDETPNRWSYGAARGYMRQLQWVRPDLGSLPYSINLAASEDLETVWAFEGRGVLKVGAHTAGHNRRGLGLGCFGNFDRGDTDAAQVLVDAIETITRDLLHGRSDVPWLDYYLPNLGSVKNPHGWDAWGHRDSSPKSCPGDHLYPLLEQFTLEDPMPSPKDWTPEDWAAVETHVWDHRAGADNTKVKHLLDRASRNAAEANRKVSEVLGDVTDLDDEDLDKIATAVADEQARRQAE